MIQLNLLPDVKKEFLHAQSTRRKTIAIAILATIIAVGLTILTAIYVYAIQNAIMYVQTEDIKTKTKELSSIKDIDKYLTVQNQLAQLSSLHGEKNNFSRLLDFLPRLNPAPPKNVVLTNLDVSAVDGTIIFKGRVGDYGALTTFKDTLSNAKFTYQYEGEDHAAANLFSDVTIDSATYEKTQTSAGVTFSVTVKYDPAVFMQQNVAVQVTVPNIETTDSVVSSPQAIFGGSQ